MSVASGDETSTFPTADSEKNSEFNQIYVIYALLLTYSPGNLDLQVVEKNPNNANTIDLQPKKPLEKDFRGSRALHNDQANEPVFATSGLNESDLAGHSDVPDNESQAVNGDENETNDISDGDSVNERHEFLREKYANMEKRIRLAPKRLKQQIQYTNILEERITMLEERFDLFDRKLQKPGALPLPASEGDPQPSSTLKPVLNFQFWQDFKSNATPPQHIIDVLIGEPEMPPTEKTRRRKTFDDALPSDTNKDMASSRDLPTLDALSSTKKRDLADEVAELKGNHMPERIRINLPAILHLFSKFFYQNYHGSLYNIMLYPFKPLLYNFEEIQELMSDVMEHTDSNPYKTIETSKVEAPTKETNKHGHGPRESCTAETIHIEEWEQILKDLGHFHCRDCTKAFGDDWLNKPALESSFRCIRDLLDNYLLPVHLKLHEQQAEEVHFRELWHLFQIGDLIVTNPSKSQRSADTASTLGMRVFMTTGGRRVINRASSPPIYLQHSSAKTTEDTTVAINGINPFCIQAHYTDFDGSRLVTARRRFVIPPYIGKRKVVDFEVYSVGYTSTIE
jgi:hypothetical protein